MLKVIAVILLLIGGWLAYRGFFVWNHCGYDCHIGTYWINLSATTAMLLGAIVLVLGIAALATMLPGARPRSS